MKKKSPNQDTFPNKEECTDICNEIAKIAEGKNAGRVAISCVVYAGVLLATEAKFNDKFNAEVVIKDLIKILVDPYELYLESTNESGEL